MKWSKAVDLQAQVWPDLSNGKKFVFILLVVISHDFLDWKRCVISQHFKIDSYPLWGMHTHVSHIMPTKCFRRSDKLQMTSKLLNNTGRSPRSLEESLLPPMWVHIGAAAVSLDPYLWISGLQYYKRKIWQVLRVYNISYPSINRNNSALWVENTLMYLQLQFAWRPERIRRQKDQTCKLVNSAAREDSGAILEE